MCQNLARLCGVPAGFGASERGAGGRGRFGLAATQRGRPPSPSLHGPPYVGVVWVSRMYPWTTGTPGGLCGRSRVMAEGQFESEHNRVLNGLKPQGLQLNRLNDIPTQVIRSSDVAYFLAVHLSCGVDK